MNRRLVIFARAPRAGRVKTRLAAAVGAESALGVYRRLFARTLEVAAAVGCPVTLSVDGEDDATMARVASGRGWNLTCQRGEDLGARMHAAFVDAFDAGAGRVVLIGCDCPVLLPSDLDEAFERLEHEDAVFAPAEDGGYVLVGLVRPLPPLFAPMAWGGADVMAETRRRLHSASIRWSELRELWDLDRPDDHRRWLDLLERGADPMGTAGRRPDQP